MEVLIIAIMYAVFSAFLNSQKAKKKKANRPVTKEFSLEEFLEQKAEKAEAEKKEKAAPKPKVKEKRKPIFDLSKNEEKKAKQPQMAVPKKKKSAPKTLINEERINPKKEPITPIKKEEHHHPHKRVVESRLAHRSLAQSSIANRKVHTPIQVQILADAEQSTEKARFNLKVDQEALVNGIIWNEILAKPRALRK